jgi:hypothetical protein
LASSPEKMLPDQGSLSVAARARTLAMFTMETTPN